MSKRFKVRIDKLVYGGKGLARLNGRTIFVPRVAPGDLVLVEEVERKSGYSEAEVVDVLEESKHRTTPRCPYFGRCGGCDWQHIKYESQVEFKRAILEESLQKIGRIKKPNIDEVIPSPHPWHYRNRAQLKVDGSKVGFFGKGTHTVVNVDRCYLLKKEICELPGRVKQVLARLRSKPADVHIYHSFKGEAFLKFIYTGRFKAPELGVEELANLLGVNIVGYGVYSAKGDGAPERVSFFGRDFTYEPVGRFRFRVSADSFFQVNAFQVENLIARVSRTAMEQQYMVAGDLYCGVGTLTVPVARYVHRTFGVESSFPAVADAIYNRDINGLRNITFYCRQVESAFDVLRDYAPDLLVLDPPRGGLSQRVIRELVQIPRLKKLVYVSCNPSTLARDVALFYQAGFAMEKVKLLDMFPQTYHIEAIAYLRRVR